MYGKVYRAFKQGEEKYTLIHLNKKTSPESCSSLFVCPFLNTRSGFFVHPDFNMVQYPPKVVQKNNAAHAVYY